ncbi:MAG: hypothetical protein Q8P56_06220 [Candidatus Uhrbacteria bacterium]|nr:hypothetical protein [Candidatus Uhrbacteria bacterium]
MKHSLISSIATVITLAIVVFAISAFFISNERLIGFVLIALFLLCMASLIPFGIALRSIQPDIIFGVIDNGILVVFALIGGEVAGIPGAIVGGAVGNAATDGIAGVFEGYWAERLRKRNVSDQRTIVGSAIGKMGGCLLGAGVVLIIVSFLRVVFP